MPQLSPVKQKMKDSLNLTADEYILVVNGMYQYFKQSNPKASRVDALVGCLTTWFRQYGRGKTLAGINKWIKAIETRQINPKVPSEKSKLGQAYIEGIIRNTKDTFVSVSHMVSLEQRCDYCQRILTNGVCTNCG